MRSYRDGRANFKNPGQTNVRFTLAGKTVSIPITVVQLPFRSAGGLDSGVRRRLRPNADRPRGPSPADDVVRLIGLPDEKEKHFISWPESATIDGIYYGSSDPRWSISTEHWKFNKYPGAVIAIVANRVHAVATYADERQEPQVFLP